MKNIIDEIAKEEGLPSHIVERIVNSQFKFIYNTMKSGTFQPVRLTYFGVFGVRPGRRACLMEKTNRKGKWKDSNSQ